VIQSLLNVLSCDAQADSSCLRCARSRNDKKGGASELWSGHWLKGRGPADRTTL